MFDTDPSLHSAISKISLNLLLFAFLLPFSCLRNYWMNVFFRLFTWPFFCLFSRPPFLSWFVTRPWLLFRVAGSQKPVAVAARSKAWTVFAFSNTWIVGSNPTQGMDVCVCLFCVFVVLCVGSGLATGWSPSKESYWLWIGLRKWKSGQGPTKRWQNHR
jgi:hypothetical protein